jgi:hypothetical protein
MSLDLSSIAEYRARLLSLLKDVLAVRLDTSPKKKRKLPGARPNLSVDLFAGKERWELLVETKPNGEPRMIRGAIQQLQSYLATWPKTYGIIAAPYLGPRSQEICKEAGLGYLDLAGNCRLVFGPVFIERKGYPNPSTERRTLRTLFAPRASRILRVLLEDPKRGWQVQAMAKQAKVSIGLAFKVKQRLLDLEYIREEEKELRLTRPEDLLRDWSVNYSYRKSSALDCFSPGDPPEAEQALTSYCRKRRITYAFALFSGAARVAPFARYTRGFAYVVSDASEVARGLGWKSVPTGANFTLLTPYDEGLLIGAREVSGETVVTDIQLYLDLTSFTGRGEEAATFILEQRLRPRW